MEKKSTVREPVQKRSMEKKEQISKAGFELFCEKGFHKTNTTEIATRAGVSTGALYSYFRDKRDIYIASFEQYIQSLSGTLFSKLDALPRPFTIAAFAELWVTEYLNVFGESGKAFTQLRTIMLEDEVIKKHFCNFENDYFGKILSILISGGIVTENMFMKVYLSSVLIDALNNEYAGSLHEGLDFKSLQRETEKMIQQVFAKE